MLAEIRIFGGRHHDQRQREGLPLEHPQEPLKGLRPALRGDHDSGSSRRAHRAIWHWQVHLALRRVHVHLGPIDSSIVLQFHNTRVSDGGALKRNFYNQMRAPGRCLDGTMNVGNYRHFP